MLPPAPGLDHVAAEHAQPTEQPDHVTTYSSTPYASSAATTTTSSAVAVLLELRVTVEGLSVL